ncbi:mitochondrial carrier protein LEU5 [Hypoxylon trugodes]|uniref:mitochondrial carrier protein LEU5 n=1 Tax=Hypoxylon trugodes TaxID=326681 RepID=UPI00219F4E71|nr:mitochondrial carrier protein LEU5 [Hypoxylon trugodes]KAI1386380.1 mitochondrial carrier protein LEU5 [Hypoxylon trugodes]
MSEFPSHREGHASALVGKMDGVVRKASSVVTGNTSYSANTDSVDEEPPIARKENEPDKRSLDYVIRSGIAGGLAGCAAKTTVAPLDRVKILFQTSNPQFAKYQGSWAGFGIAIRDIYARDGVFGLFRGHSATLLKIYPYAAIKFVAYEQYRALIIGSNRQNETWIRRFSTGALAGVTSVFVTYPLEVIRVRLAFETKHRSSSLADICKKIYHEQPLPKSPLAPAQSGSGVTGAVAEAATSTAQAVTPRSGLINFYRGFSTTILGMIPYAGISFLTHDTAGDIFRLPSIRKYTTLPKPVGSPSDKPEPLRAWAELIAGGISGAVSQTVSYPLEVIRRRMQVSGAVGDGHRLRIGETAGMIFRERGIPGFFVGLSIGYIKVVPLAAVSFYTYERLKTLFSI